MKPRLILILTVAAALTACATAGSNALAVCDGRHLRPANPNGSVLNPAKPAAFTAAAPSAAAPNPSCGP
jgi:type IV secretion system protein VirB7